MNNFKQGVSAAIGIVVAVWILATNIEMEAKQSISTIVNDYCSKRPEFRHFVRAEVNRIVFPHKVEITCGEKDE